MDKQIDTQLIYDCITYKAAQYNMHIHRNKKIHLLLAGATIELIFHHCEISYYQKRFLTELYAVLGGFMTPFSLKKKPDIHINIIHVIEPPTVTIGPGKRKVFKKYALLCDKIGNNFTTFYYINMIQFTQILNTIMQEYLVKVGFFFHASASYINGQAVLFLGHSGAGKSTITSLLSKKYKIVADDRIFIKKEHGQFYLYQTPFIEKASEIQKSANRYPISKIYLLQQSKQYSLQKIEDKITIISTCFQQLWIDESNQKYKVQLLMEFIDKIPSFSILSFGLEQKKVIQLVESI